MARVSLDEIKKQAYATLTELKKFQNLSLQEIADLSHRNPYKNTEIFVSIDETLDGPDSFLRNGVNPKTSVEYIRFDTWEENIEYPTLNMRTGKFYFDVYDEEVDDEYAYIEDATLESIKADYEVFDKKLDDTYSISAFEFNLMSEWTRRTHLDEVMDVHYVGNGVSNIYDMENDTYISLKEGFDYFSSAIAYSFEHEGFNEFDSETLYSLFERITGEDFRYLRDRDLENGDIER